MSHRLYCALGPYPTRSHSVPECKFGVQPFRFWQKDLGFLYCTVDCPFPCLPLARPVSCWRLVQGPTTRGWLEPGAAWGALLGHSDGSVSSSALPGAPIHSKESHTFPLDIRIEPNCAPGQSPASSAGPSRPGKGSQMVLA